MIFNSKFHKLGKLCKHGHDYNGLGLSLRGIKSGGCAICRSIVASKYRTSHMVEILEYKRIYRLNNLEKTKAKEKRFRLNNKEKIRLRDTTYYAKNKERERARATAYRLANPEKIKAWRLKKTIAKRAAREKAILNNPVPVQVQKSRDKAKRYRLAHPEVIKKNNRKAQKLLKEIERISQTKKPQRTVDQDIADLRLEVIWFNNLLQEIKNEQAVQVETECEQELELEFA